MQPLVIAHRGALLRQFGLERCLVTSFLDRVLVEAKALAPELQTGLLVGAGIRRALAIRLPASRADCLALHRRLADATTLSQAGTAGVPCVVWTVNDEHTMDRLLGHAAVAGLITDRPTLALERRARLAPPTERTAPPTGRTAPATLRSAPTPPRPDRAGADGTAPPYAG